MCSHAKVSIVELYNKKTLSRAKKNINQEIKGYTLYAMCTIEYAKTFRDHSYNDELTDEQAQDMYVVKACDSMRHLKLEPETVSENEMYKKCIQNTQT